MHGSRCVLVLEGFDFCGATLNFVTYLRCEELEGFQLSGAQLQVF